MKLQYGSIYFVEFDPSTGHEFQKTRPAVLLSSSKLIKKSSLISCVPFTGNTGNHVEGDILVKKTRQNNLFMDSVLKSRHISTFDKRRIKKYVGDLEGTSLEKLKKQIVQNFDLI